jgi:hypothetical protein
VAHCVSFLATAEAAGLSYVYPEGWQRSTPFA